MKKLFLFIILIYCCYSCNIFGGNNYPQARVVYKDLCQSTQGSQLFNENFPNIEDDIKNLSQNVMRELYFKNSKSIPRIRRINYKLKKYKGVSRTFGKAPEITIVCSSLWIENLNSVDIKPQIEHRITKELARAYQLEPRGIGNYDNNRVFRALVDGIAMAVAIKNGHYNPSYKPSGGKYDDGGETTAHFLVWINDKYDSNFIRKLNISTIDIIPWSFDKAFKRILGNKIDANKLWKKYLSEENITKNCKE